MEKKGAAKWLRVLYFTFPVIWLLNLILPFVFKPLINKALKGMEGYKGRVSRFRIRLFPAAFIIKGFRLEKTAQAMPLAEVKLLHLDLYWKDLWKKVFRCELVLEDIHVHMEKEQARKDEPEKETGAEPANISIEMPRLPFPVLVDKIKVRRCSAGYHDAFAEPKVQVTIDDIEIFGSNIATQAVKNNFPAKITVLTRAYGGTMNLDLRATLFEKQPGFDMNMELRDVNLAELNEYFAAYGKFDVSAGRFGLFSEVAVKGNRFKGYVKPVISDLKVLGREDRHDSLLHKLWEGLVGAMANIIENHKKEQVATKVPLEGTFSNPHIKIWAAIGEVLRNAFVVALKPAIDNEINLGSLKK